MLLGIYLNSQRIAAWGNLVPDSTAAKGYGWLLWKEMHRFFFHSSELLLLCKEGENILRTQSFINNIWLVSAIGTDLSAHAEWKSRICLIQFRDLDPNDRINVTF